MEQNSTLSQAKTQVKEGIKNAWWESPPGIRGEESDVSADEKK